MSQQSCSSQPKPADAVIKHRACDECRSRKLACTKEPDGCSRCKGENLTCVYSPQKQMGRPRKRRHVEESQEQPSSAPQAGEPNAQVLPPTTLDADFSDLFDQDFSNFDYLGLLSPLDGLPPSTLPPELGSLTNMPYAEPRQPTGDFPFGVGGAGLLDGINFGEGDAADEELPQDISQSITDLLSAQMPDFNSASPSPPTSSKLSNTTSNSTPEFSSSLGKTTDVNADSGDDTTTALKAYINTTCSCLSQMFFSLDGLSRLSHDVKVAMGMARQAARVAHDVIHCPACSKIDITKPPPMQAFQNMMMLGALLPATANAYAKILELIDAEAARAKSENRLVKLHFAEYGGLWGEVQKMEGSCGILMSLDNRELDADSWRLTVRGLLQLDIYGHDFEGTNGAGAKVKYHHMGLKDVLHEMEDRSKRRHEKIDALVAAGHPHPMKHPEHSLLEPEGNDNSKEKRPCLKIIEVARIAVDKLVIA